MNDELKACPFCGSHYIFNKDNGMGQNLTGCDKCGARIYYKFNTLEDAKKAWNNRPIEDNLRNQLDKTIDVLIEIGDKFEGLPPGNIANEALMNIAGNK